jgi:hypothetical protein
MLIIISSLYCVRSGECDSKLDYVDI